MNCNPGKARATNTAVSPPYICALLFPAASPLPLDHISIEPVFTGLSAGSPAGTPWQSRGCPTSSASTLEPELLGTGAAAPMGAGGAGNTPTHCARHRHSPACSCSISHAPGEKGTRKAKTKTYQEVTHKDSSPDAAQSPGYLDVKQ